MEPRILKTTKRSTAARARVWRLQSDALLCDAAANGNELAFSELYRRHYRDLSAFVFHFLGARHRHEDAEDVVQDAFVRAFDAIRDRRFDGDFRRWIFTIARNRSIDLLRGERSRLTRPEPPVLGPTAETTAETREEVAWLVAEIEKLPERQRSALLLRELAGLSHEAIGEELETTPASVRQLIARAREGMRSAAERDGREHAPLRRELIDAAVPTIPLAATGIIATTGTTAGGSIAFGKVVATVLATLMLAGAAGTVSREVSDASGSPDKTSATKPVAIASSNGTRDLPSGASSGKQLNSDSTEGALPNPEKHSSPNAPQTQDLTPGAGVHETEAQKPASQEAAPESAPSRPQPVKKVLELPGNVVEDVTDGLNGSSPPDQVVGNVLTDVADTLGETTSGLLGQGSGSGSGSGAR